MNQEHIIQQRRNRLHRAETPILGTNPSGFVLLRPGTPARLRPEGLRALDKDMFLASQRPKEQDQRHGNHDDDIEDHPRLWQAGQASGKGPAAAVGQQGERHGQDGTKPLDVLPDVVDDPGHVLSDA